MKISTHPFWILALLCLIPPCPVRAQNATLINTYTNPAPTSGDNFGYSVAAVGNDHVLIGAPFDSTGALYAGSAYLFSTNGALLTTFTNPTPASLDCFGAAVAAVGNDRVLMGAFGDDTGEGDAGVAYLFKLETSTPEAPSLTISFNPQHSTLDVSRPAPTGDWQLQTSSNLLSAGSAWTKFPPPHQTNGTVTSVTVPNTSATGNHFFRLHKP